MLSGGGRIMPIHDWTRVPAELFHHFHQDWTIELARALNRGRLPKGTDALVEQRSGPLETDVLAVERRTRPQPSALDGGIAVRQRPAARIVRRTDKAAYSERANRVVVKHHLGRIIAVIEIVSPDNKDSRRALRHFVDKTVAFLSEGVHVLIVDLFPPTSRDPFGIHKLIWDEFAEEEFTFPQGKDRILASYESGPEMAAYVEPVTIGDVLPDMPLFLWNEFHVPTPLELTYQAAWDASPEDMRLAVETGVMPEDEGV
jgi:Protein of unknown function (DUF4058)